MESPPKEVTFQLCSEAGWGLVWARRGCRGGEEHVEVPTAARGVSWSRAWHAPGALEGRGSLGRVWSRGLFEKKSSGRSVEIGSSTGTRGGWEANRRLTW